MTEFETMDVTNGAYKDAVESFFLGWPILLEKWQGSEEFEVDIEENENKLLIICGRESNRLFWKYLCEESLLYTGGALPPNKTSFSALYGGAGLGLCCRNHKT
jgi:hypothetical protein